MNHKSTFMYFNAAYLFGLVCFAILLYLEIKNIFLTNFIIIASIILLIIKIVYWHSVNKKLIQIDYFEKQKYFILKLAYYIMSYIVPVYYIIQEPFLVVSNNILVFTFLIVIILVIIGIFIENFLFNIESKRKISL